MIDILWLFDIDIENGDRYSEFSHWKLGFSIVMFVYQMVSMKVLVGKKISIYFNQLFFNWDLDYGSHKQWLS